MASALLLQRRKKKTAPPPPSLKDCANFGAPESTVAGTHTSLAAGAYHVLLQREVPEASLGRTQGELRGQSRSERGESLGSGDGSGDGSGGGGGGGGDGGGGNHRGNVGMMRPRHQHRLAARPRNPSDECAICLEMLSTASVLSLPCSHSFHVACVEKLRNFGVSEVCPNCRVSLPPNPQLQYDDALQKFVRILRPLVDGETTLSKILAVRENKALVDETVAILKSTYKQGHGRSAWLLAGFHEDKYAVLGKNPAKSEEWYLRGAKLENTASMLNYANRVKEQGNLALAYKWFRRAAELGMAAAQLSVGVMLSKGDGVKQNHEEAVMWWRKSAEQTSVTCDLTGEAGEWNNGDACVKLGIAYEKGNGVKKVDYHEAMKWYCKAAEQETIEFQGEIGRNRIFEYKRGFIPEPLVGGRCSERHDRPAHAIGNTLAASLYMQGLGFG